jgi:hypothetical protein
MAVSKNSRVGRDRLNFFLPDSDCLPKFNYSNGAGWKSSKKAKIGGMPQERAFAGRRKKR